jgi:murein L,D-transpeptidase YcbB/YkuD
MLLRVLLLLSFLSLSLSLEPLAATFDDDVREALRRRLENAALPGVLAVGREPIYSRVSLPEFYQQRRYQPAWSEAGKPRTEAFELAASIRNAAAEGLIPEHYHLRRIETQLGALERQPSAAAAVDLDLLLTDAFLVLGSHYLMGRINPETVDPEWRAKRREGDMVRSLLEAIATGRVAASLQTLLPAAPEYAGLREALARHRQFAAEGGWPVVPSGPTLRSGDLDPRVAILRERLARSGDLDAALAAGDLFDEPLEEAVRQFQSRHGLAVDSVVGPATLAALNVPVATRIRQIELNLERWRWLPQDLGRRHILVNIAAFRLDLVEEGRSVLDMRVVVGKPYRRTPVFSGTMTYLVLNPYWEVPPRIAIRDILPEVRKDPAYLQRSGMKVFRGWGTESRELDPDGVDWAGLASSPFPYRLRQDPGPTNALGRIKFMFPNPYHVYMHDTPARELFLKEARTFSSGCIRLEKPLELALRLLQGSDLDSPEALAAALARERSKMVHLSAPLPVHLLYWTAWMTEDGIVHFRPDIYGRDLRLLAALDQPAPNAAPKKNANGSPPASPATASVTRGLPIIP